jgi:hypothetical protein
MILDNNNNSETTETTEITAETTEITAETTADIKQGLDALVREVRDAPRMRSVKSFIEQHNRTPKDAMQHSKTPKGTNIALRNTKSNKPSIPTELEPLIIKMKASGAHLSEIKLWLSDMHGITAPQTEIARIINRTISARSHIAKEIVREKLAQYLIPDLDLLQDIKAIETEKLWEAYNSQDLKQLRIAETQLIKIIDMRLKYSGVSNPDLPQDDALEALRASLATRWGVIDVQSESPAAEPAIEEDD